MASMKPTTIGSALTMIPSNITTHTSGFLSPSVKLYSGISKPSVTTVVCVYICVCVCVCVCVHVRVGILCVCVCVCACVHVSVGICMGVGGGMCVCVCVCVCVHVRVGMCMGMGGACAWVGVYGKEECTSEHDICIEE